MVGNNKTGLRDSARRIFGADRIWWEIALLALLSLAALYYRLRCALNVTYDLAGDALNYNNMALQLMKGGAFGYLSESSNAYVMPIYPYFLAVIYKIAGAANGVLAAKIVQCFLGTATALTGYLIGRRFFNRIVGFIICICLAFYPPFIMGSSSILTECLYVFLFMIYFYFQLLSVNSKDAPVRKKYILAAVSGALFALCMLVRAGAVALILVPYLYKYIVNRRDKQVSRYVKFEFLFFLGGFVLCMLPWWIRNIAVLGELVFFCTQTGNPLLYGTFPDLKIPADFYVEPKDETKVALQRVCEGFSTQPLTYLKWFTIGKFKYIFFNIWYYFPGPVSIPYHQSYLKLMHFMLVVGGWLGTVWGLMRDNLRLTCIYSIILTFLQLLVIPEERYAYTILPLLIIAMASYLFESFSLIPRKKRAAKIDNQ